MAACSRAGHGLTWRRRSAWAFFNRKPQTEPNRTAPNRSVGFFGFRFAVRFLVLHCSVFGFGFGFILKPNRLTNKTDAHTRSVAPQTARPQPTMAHQGIKPSWRLSRQQQLQWRRLPPRASVSVSRSSPAPRAPVSSLPPTPSSPSPLLPPPPLGAEKQGGRGF